MRLDRSHRAGRPESDYRDVDFVVPAIIVEGGSAHSSGRHSMMLALKPGLMRPRARDSASITTRRVSAGWITSSINAISAAR